MLKIRTTENTIWGPFIAYIQETGQTYDSTFVFVFIYIKGNMGGGGVVPVQ
jgi:hypothetical protein